ncbi:MAG TPA: acyltransferase family protein, partial [Burkholderiaceae bacterium]|nr:acyltransferase family protein [Burkholderiaceae bacterium]
NLRATMMWLGVVLHVAIVHRVLDSASFWRDPQTSPTADVVVMLIHVFRMPVFFIVSGFFAALLVERRRPGGMLANRVWRVGVPFVVFLPILFAATVVLTTTYARPVGSPPSVGFDLNVMPVKSGGVRFQTLHLWFLELLMGFALVTAILCWLTSSLPNVLRERTKQVFCRLGVSNMAFLTLALPLAVVGRNSPQGVLVTSGDLLPPAAEWLHYGLYYAFGFALYHCRHHVLPLYAQRAWRNALAGVIGIGITVAVTYVALRAPGRLPHDGFWMSLAYNACSWLLSLALIGGFVRHLHEQNQLLKYMAESSYWVYLVHLPLIGVVALALRDWHIVAELKMVLNIGVTTALSVASYHWLVRHKPIGVFLNGPGKNNESAPAHLAVSPRLDA